MSNHATSQHSDVPSWMLVPSGPLDGGPALPPGPHPAPVPQSNQAPTNTLSPIPSLSPGTAQFVFTKLGRYSLGCMHQNKTYDPKLHDHQYPRRMGFFHASSSQDDELRISFLRTEHFCLPCLDTLIPSRTFNYWTVTAGSAALQKRWLQLPSSGQSYPPLYEAGTEDFSSSWPSPQVHSTAHFGRPKPATIPIPDILGAREAWAWLAAERKPFYIDQLYLDKGWRLLSEKDAEKDAKIAQTYGVPFVMSRASHDVRAFMGQPSATLHEPFYDMPAECINSFVEVENRPRPAPHGHPDSSDTQGYLDTGNQDPSFGSVDESSVANAEAPVKAVKKKTSSSKKLAKDSSMAEASSATKKPKKKSSRLPDTTTNTSEPSQMEQSAQPQTKQAASEVKRSAESMKDKKKKKPVASVPPTGDLATEKSIVEQVKKRSTSDKPKSTIDSSKDGIERHSKSMVSISTNAVSVVEQSTAGEAMLGVTSSVETANSGIPIVQQSGPSKSRIPEFSPHSNSMISDSEIALLLGSNNSISKNEIMRSGSYSPSPNYTRSWGRSNPFVLDSFAQPQPQTQTRAQARARPETLMNPSRALLPHPVPSHVSASRTPTVPHGPNLSLVHHDNNVVKPGPGAAGRQIKAKTSKDKEKERRSPDRSVNGTEKPTAARSDVRSQNIEKEQHADFEKKIESALKNKKKAVLHMDKLVASKTQSDKLRATTKAQSPDSRKLSKLSRNLANPGLQHQNTKLDKATTKVEKAKKPGQAKKVKPLPESARQPRPHLQQSPPRIQQPSKAGKKQSQILDKRAHLASKDTKKVSQSSWSNPFRSKPGRPQYNNPSTAHVTQPGKSSTSGGAHPHSTHPPAPSSSANTYQASSTHMQSSEASQIQQTSIDNSNSGAHYGPIIYNTEATTVYNGPQFGGVIPHDNATSGGHGNVSSVAVNVNVNAEPFDHDSTSSDESEPEVDEIGETDSNVSSHHEDGLDDNESETSDAESSEIEPSEEESEQSSGEGNGSWENLSADDSDDDEHSNAGVASDNTDDEAQSTNNITDTEEVEEVYSTDSETDGAEHDSDASDQEESEGGSHGTDQSDDDQGADHPSSEDEGNGSGAASHASDSDESSTGKQDSELETDAEASDSGQESEGDTDSGQLSDGNATDSDHQSTDNDQSSDGDPTDSDQLSDGDGTESDHSSHVQELEDDDSDEEDAASSDDVVSPVSESDNEGHMTDG